MGGWLRPESAWAAQLLSSFQESIGVCGGIGEIGVHHGKLTIGLAHTLNGHHRGLALDLFDDQSKNVDNSGKGDKDIFLKNLARFGVAEQVLNIVQGSSMEVDPKTFGNGVAPCEDFKVLGAT
ncbi:hypothetical protein HK104_001091 [Borealophlyctis nickersoniae]|nr:hypothetical protein HK104_001091 [Borealophlyctis nickersoniae]